jgi:hypothetical protein
MLSRSATLSQASLLASALYASWRSSLEPFSCTEEEFNRLAPLLINSGAAALVWRRLRSCGSPLCSIVSATELHQLYRLNTLYAGRHERNIREVFRMLRSARIEPILIKGWAIARLYTEKGLRPYGDIDLCVAPEQYAKAKALLYDAEGGNKYRVDLEHDEIERLDHRGWDEIYGRSQLVKLCDESVRVLSPEDHLRALCIHFLKEGACRPVSLCDIALAVESRPPDFDWGICLGEDEPQANWVACSIGLAHQLLGARVDDTPVAKSSVDLPEWLAPCVLKQWAGPFRIEAAMRDYLRNPAMLLKGFRRRWPDPVTATISLRAEFDESLRLPYQLRTYLAPSRIRKFVAGLSVRRPEREAVRRDGIS